MRLLPVVLLAAAASCARSARPSQPPAAPPDLGAAATPPAEAVVATVDLLASLELTGATWEDQLAEVPPERARAVAIEFLRAGDLACTDLVHEDAGCGMTEDSFAEVAGETTLHDPCLRRQVAVWALQHLEATDVPAVADALAMIVALPRPEAQLTTEVVTLLPPGDDVLRLRLIAAAATAGRDDVADALLPGLTPAGAAQALVELGRPAALPLLGDHPQRGTLAAAIERGVADGEILDGLTAADLDDPALADAVRFVATGNHCRLAAVAAGLFDEAGDPQYLPSHAAIADEAAATRALCIAANLSGLEGRAVLEKLLTRDGLDLVTLDRSYWGGDDADDDDLDGDGDPRTHTSREHITRADLDADTLVEWLPSECDGNVCNAATGSVTLAFSRGPRGGLALDEITIEHVEEGCGC